MTRPRREKNSKLMVEQENYHIFHLCIYTFSTIDVHYRHYLSAVKRGSDVIGGYRTSVICLPGITARQIATRLCMHAAYLPESIMGDEHCHFPDPTRIFLCTRFLSDLILRLALGTRFTTFQRFRSEERFVGNFRGTTSVYFWAFFCFK